MPCLWQKKFRASSGVSCVFAICNPVIPPAKVPERLLYALIRWRA